MKGVLGAACVLVGILSGCFSIWLLGFMVIGPAYYGPVPGWAWVVFFLVLIHSILCFVAAWHLWQGKKE